MTDWTEMEQGALGTMLANDGPLKRALQKFIAGKAQEHKASCAMHMATVPRNPEAAADHAAKAQILDEFWTLLTEELLSAGQPTQV